MTGSYLVVEVTLMFVAVSVNGAEQAATATGEPSQSDLLLAGVTSVLLLLPVLLSILTGPRGSELWSGVLPVPRGGEDGHCGLTSRQAGGGGGGGGEVGEAGSAGGGWTCNKCHQALQTCKLHSA